MVLSLVWGPLAFVVSAAAAEVSIEHRAVGCVVAERFPVIDARIAPSGSISRARVFFRAGGTPHWYFVDMRAERGAFLATLPKPLKTTKTIEYYIQAFDRSLAEARSADYAPQVVESAGMCPPNLVWAAILTSAKVGVGTLTGGAPAVPMGFSGVGILPASVAGATGIASAGAAAGGGISTGAVLGIVGGATAVAAGVAVVSGGTPTPSAPTNVTGHWVGSLVVTVNVECDVEDDLTLDLNQSGGSVSGSYRVVPRRLSGRAGCQSGDTRGSVSGSVSGTSVTLVLVASGFSVTATGALSGNTISGTFTCSPNCNQAGTFSVTRQ